MIDLECISQMFRSFGTYLVAIKNQSSECLQQEVKMSVCSVSNLDAHLT